MEIYNKLTDELTDLIKNGKIFPFSSEDVCPPGEKGTLILSKDTAFEFGGSMLPAVNLTLFNTDDSIKDEVILIGPDIGEISKDIPYARAAIVSLDKSSLPDENDVYRTLKDIEFSKYRFYPADCLIRLSPESKREQIRISKKAVKDGLSLKNIGFGFINEYKKNPAVKAVKIVFVTQQDFDYKKLKNISEQASKITESLNRIFDGLELDCKTCELKAICDEVEGMRELHFGKEKKK